MQESCARILFQPRHLGGGKSQCPSPVHLIFGRPLRKYPSLHLYCKAEPIVQHSPALWPFSGWPGSTHVGSAKKDIPVYIHITSCWYIKDNIFWCTISYGLHLPWRGLWGDCDFIPKVLITVLALQQWGCNFIISGYAFPFNFYTYRARNIQVLFYQ